MPDNQGTVRNLVDSSGTLADHIAYSPFGKPLTHTASEPAVVDFLFEHDGSFYDRTTGLEHDGQRGYDPLIKRWLTQDPGAPARLESLSSARQRSDEPTDSTGLIKRGKDGQIIATDNGGGVSVHSQPNGSVAVRMRSWSIFADDGTPIQAWEN